MRKLATLSVQADGVKVFTLGPIKDLRPFDQLVWHIVYRQLKVGAAYQWLWRKYHKESK